MSIENYYSEAALIKRWPQWEKQTKSGDFKIFLDSFGHLVITWPNTSIFAPTIQDFAIVTTHEFSPKELLSAKYKAEICGLTIRGDIPHPLPSPLPEQ